MIVSLSAMERVIYLGILSTFQHGGFARWKAVDAAKNVLYFSQKEKEAIGLEESGKTISMKNVDEAKKEKKCNIPDPVHHSVLEYIRLRNTQGSVTEEIFVLAKKVIPDEVEKDDGESSPAKEPVQ
jgi:hypothetical protein